MTKNCRARLRIPGLARHFFVILPSCYGRSLFLRGQTHKKTELFHHSEEDQRKLMNSNELELHRPSLRWHLSHYEHLGYS